MPIMFGHVIKVDKYIIQIDYNTNIQKIREKIVYKLLKNYRSINSIINYLNNS